MTRRPSPQTAALLQALAAEPASWRYGYELGQEVGLKAGSLYPILIRLHERGLLESSWESEPPQGRPPRHLYRLTRAGAELAAELTAADRSAERSSGRSAERPAPRMSPRPEAQLRGAW